MNRVTGIVQQKRLERDLDDELQLHLEMKTQENIEAGMSAEAARLAALRSFGGVEQRKEECRDADRLRWIEDLAQDARYGWRQILRNPGFAALAVLSLAIGIGGNAAMFSVINQVLIRPLPYPQADRLVRVTGYYPKGAIADLQQESRTMEVAAYTADSEFNLSGEGEAQRLQGSAVSANLFKVLGVGAELGRTFHTGEDRPGQDRLVILSDALWRSKFGGDPAIEGRIVKIDGEDRQVAGVMPAGFAFPSAGVQLWIPAHFDPRNTFDSWNTNFMPLVARLRRGATPQQARAELHPLISHVITLFPYPMAAGWNADATIMSLQQDLVSDVRSRLVILQCAVGLVLLIACVNIAGLLLSRATSRRKEMALRAALGAGRERIVRQLLTESLLLSLAGGGLGLALASAGLAALKLVLPVNRAGWSKIAMDWHVLAFTSALAILTGLAFGIVPAFSASRVNLNETLKTGGRRSTGAVDVRVRGALIAGEVALAVVLTVSAGLLVKSLWRLGQVNPGFRPQQIVTIRVSPDPSLCSERAACVSLYHELEQRVRGITGVSEVAAANAIPLDGQVPSIPAEMEGHPVVPGENLGSMLWAGAVTPGYFHLMGIPLLEGRGFSDTDTETSAPVVVVSASMARKFWPGQDPIGKHIRPVWGHQAWRTVVGVAADVRQFNLANHSPDFIAGAIFMPYPQAVDIHRQLPTSMTLLVRTSLSPAEVGSQIRELVSGVNPNVPVDEVRSMTSVVTASTAQSRGMMWLFISFAGVALLLAAVGTYGVISHSTAQRSFEIGVRVVMGATRGNIFGLVLGQSLRLVLLGVALGVMASLELTRMLSTFLYGTGTSDPVTLAGVIILLVVIGLLAGYVPARRAASVDPLTALRVE